MCDSCCKGNPGKVIAGVVIKRLGAGALYKWQNAHLVPAIITLPSPSCPSIWSQPAALFSLPHLLLPRPPRISFWVLEAWLSIKKTCLGSPPGHTTLQGSCKGQSEHQGISCSSCSFPRTSVDKSKKCWYQATRSMQPNCSNIHGAFEHWSCARAFW